MRSHEKRADLMGDHAERGDADANARAAGIPVDRVMDEHATGWQGLSADEASARLSRVGQNRLPRAPGPSLPRQFLGQITHFFAVMLWAAAALAFVGGLPELGWAIIAVVLLNGAFSFAQEYRAERATRALSSLLPHATLVVRDGHRIRVESTLIVPGDIVVVTEGDRISADARVIRTDGLSVDNSTLTGESEPLPRSAAVARTDPSEADNLVFAGTYATSGSALAVVLTTGGRTRLGAIAHLTERVERRPTPLRESLQRSVRTIGAVAVGCGMAFFGVSLLLGGSPRSGFLFSVGVIVALVPEGLLPTLTLALAMGAKRMAERGALVRRLEAVETLGSTTVICTDKTGTVTANQMTARRVAIVPGRPFHVSGSGYALSGNLHVGGRPLSSGELSDIAPLLHAAALCGDARLREENGRWRCSGDPTEGALMVLARKGGVDREGAERAAPRVREFPFDSLRQRMSTLHWLPSGDLELLVKGAPERILGICSVVRRNDGVVPLDADEEARIVGEVEAMAAEGLRVLALARRALSEQPESAELAERDLEFLGLVGLEDPVRAEVPDAIDRCRRAGIRVIMITGDHPATAAAVARKAGLRFDRVLLGAELPADEDELARLLAAGDVVIARATPEHKLRIAESLQAHGEVVAMTGDGVNDAPALRRADIGVAMGKAGTDVAREAADIILLDDSFAHIVEAIEEGRSAFDNIKRFLTYHLTDNVAELAPFLAWALSAGRIPLVLSVLQILALDIGTDLLPALALGAERPEPGTMQRPPRARHSRLLDRKVLARAFGFLGPVEGLVAMAVLPVGAAVLYGWRPGLGLPSEGRDLATLSTVVFATIVAMQMANAFECRSTPASLLRIGPFTNRLLAGAVATEALALGAFVYLPPLRRALGHVPLGGKEWIAAPLGFAALMAAEEARKWVVRRRRATGEKGGRASEPDEGFVSRSREQGTLVRPGR